VLVGHGEGRAAVAIDVAMQAQASVPRPRALASVPMPAVAKGATKREKGALALWAAGDETSRLEARATLREIAPVGNGETVVGKERLLVELAVAEHDTGELDAAAQIWTTLAREPQLDQAARLRFAALAAWVQLSRQQAIVWPSDLASAIDAADVHVPELDYVRAWELLWKDGAHAVRRMHDASDAWTDAGTRAFVADEFIFMLVHARFRRDGVAALLGGDVTRVRALVLAELAVGEIANAETDVAVVDDAEVDARVQWAKGKPVMAVQLFRLVWQQRQHTDDAGRLAIARAAEDEWAGSGDGEYAEAARMAFGDDSAEVARLRALRVVDALFTKPHYTTAALEMRLELLQPRVANCYQRALATNAALEGTIAIAFTIGVDGRPFNVRAKSDEALAAVRDCVVDDAKEWWFARPGKHLTVTANVSYALSRI
jgi:hypothetical protein